VRRSGGGAAALRLAGVPRKRNADQGTLAALEHAEMAQVSVRTLAALEHAEMAQVSVRTLAALEHAD
jgi:hypothetical protein